MAVLSTTNNSEQKISEYEAINQSINLSIYLSIYLSISLILNVA